LRHFYETPLNPGVP